MWLNIRLWTLEPHFNGPITPNLSTPTSRPPKTVSLCRLFASCSNFSYEDMSRVTSLKKLWPPAWPCTISSPSTWRTGSGSSWRGIVASYQNMAMFVEVKVCIPESINSVSIFYSWVCAARARCALAGLRCSRVGSTSWWGGVPFPGAGRPVATTINDSNVLNSWKHGVNIFNAE